MTEAEVGAAWEGWVHATAPASTARSSSRSASRSSGRGRGSARSRRPAAGRSQEHEPTLFEIWVCADGYWCDHTKNFVPGELSERYAELERQLLGVYGAAVEFCRPGASLAELDRMVREGIAEMGYPGQPSHPICHGVGARAHEPPYAHQAGGGTIEAGMVLAIEPGVYWPEGGGLRVEDNFLITGERGREALPLPRRDRAGVTIDRDKLWTGELNQRALEPQTHDTVGLYDTTLRDGEQTVGVVFSPEDKLAIARALDEAGVDRIEAGFPRVSAEDAEAIRLIADAGLDAEVWGFARAVQADVEPLAELGVRAAVVESPISDAKLAALGVSQDDMLGRIRKAVSFAAGEGITVAFFGVDGSRAELGFFQRAYEAAVEAGAKEAVVVDTIGIATPEAAAYLVGQAVDWLDVPVHWHGHDDFGLATAAAVSAVQAGATWVHGTVNGMGERAGNANLLEVALALEALYGIPTRLDLTRRASSRPSCGSARLPARAVDADHGREPLHPRERRGREPVPRPAGDRAVLVGARRREARDRAGEEERPRLDPAEGGGAGARHPGRPSRRRARGGQGLANAEGGSSPTPSSASVD